MTYLSDCGDGWMDADFDPPSRSDFEKVGPCRCPRDSPCECPSLCEGCGEVREVSSDGLCDPCGIAHDEEPQALIED